MAVELHRCANTWVKLKGHPCWRVQKALDDQGIVYEVVKGPLSRKKRDVVAAGTGQSSYPAIRFEDGTWYREESKDMERTIRDGRLDARRGAGATAEGE